jgi:hypothetical protein
MTQTNGNFLLPDKIRFDEDTLTDSYGKLIVEPLERGFGTTVGNALRRILYSSIEGSAVYAVKLGHCPEYKAVEIQDARKQAQDGFNRCKGSQGSNGGRSSDRFESGGHE